MRENGQKAFSQLLYSNVSPYLASFQRHYAAVRPPQTWSKIGDVLFLQPRWTMHQSYRQTTDGRTTHNGN